jgi:cyclase
MADAYGSKSVVLSIDAKRVENSGDLRWHAFSHGGKTDTGRCAIEWAVRAAELGAGEILVNSIDADGTGEGYDLELTRRIVNAVQVPVIASGGAGSLEQIVEGLLVADAALVASMLHFEKTTIQEIKAYAKAKGISVN